MNGRLPITSSSGTSSRPGSFFGRSLMSSPRPAARARTRFPLPARQCAPSAGSISACCSVSKSFRLPSATLAADLAPSGARCGNRWRCVFRARFMMSVGVVFLQPVRSSLAGVVVPSSSASGTSTTSWAHHTGLPASRSRLNARDKYR